VHRGSGRAGLAATHEPVEAGGSVRRLVPLSTRELDAAGARFVRVAPLPSLTLQCLVLRYYSL
jgi:hypothetical protein